MSVCVLVLFRSLSFLVIPSDLLLYFGRLYTPFGILLYVGASYGVGHTGVGFSSLLQSPSAVLYALLHFVLRMYEYVCVCSLRSIYFIHVILRYFISTVYEVVYYAFAFFDQTLNNKKKQKPIQRQWPRLTSKKLAWNGHYILLQHHTWCTAVLWLQQAVVVGGCQQQQYCSTYSSSAFFLSTAHELECRRRRWERILT